MHMPGSPLSRSMIVLLAGGLASCAGEQSEPAEQIERVVQGECQEVFGGEVCTWGTIVGDVVVEFGATVPMAMVENAPPEGEMVFPPPSIGRVALPEEVATATGFDHLGMNWEPHGHPPGLFLTPHFDFHFYTIDPERVEAIDCVDLSKPAETAPGYTLPDIEIPELGELVGLCVPSMGMHAMLETELDDTVPFGASMILGYYEQGLIFLEPMIAQAKLGEAMSFTMDVPTVQAPGAGVKWPASFEAVYDEAARTYRFVFSGLPSQ